MDFLRSDLRHACRRLLASPGFALIAIASIALGVGASTAVFGAVRAILFAALPYPQAQRVVALTDRDSEGGRLAVAYGTYREIAGRSRSFDRLAVADRWQPALVADAGDPERLDGDRVSAAYFRVLGMAPAIGRDFAAEDDVRGAPPVAIVTATLAARRLGGASGALGRPIVLDGATYTVIGVMPDGFKNALAPTAEVWVPLRYRAEAGFQDPEWGHHLRMIGRLAAGVTLAQAVSDVRSIGRSPTEDFARPAWAPMSDGLIVESLLDSMTIGVRPALLAIACVNLSNLLLARTLARRAELAIRTALGAGRSHLLRQLVTESLVIALLGGIAGVGVAVAMEATLQSLAPASLARAGAFRLDVSVFALALVASTLVGSAAGVLPGLSGIHEGTYTAVRAGSHVTDSQHRVTRRALVVTQVALAFVLLTSAGLLFRSVEKLLATEPGFDPERVLTMQVVATGRRYGSSAELQQFYERALDAVRALPGVADAAFTSQLPLSGESDYYGVAFQSDTRADQRNAAGAVRYTVTPAWFATMRIPLLEGRLLGAEDRPGAPQAALISASFARR
jgi:predicted permease